MSKELIISTKKGVIIAIIENGKLTELHRENINNKFSVGDLYVGIVKTIAIGINAAFINIGSSKDAFLHYQDLGPQFKSSINLFNKSSINLENKGLITDLLHTGQKILVQITKEPISNKGHRLTAEISIAGRYLILMPFLDKILISKKIKDNKERHRLISIIKNIKPKNFGIIIRTIAGKKKIDSFKKDINYLINKWNNVVNMIVKKSETEIPYKLLSEKDKASCILRDTFNDDYTSIICDDESLYKDIYTNISIIAPHKTNIIKYYNGITPIFEKYGIEKQIKILFGKNVPLTKGAYLVIEHTEALHVIDINSGIHINGSKENTALEINIIAATEIARQIRLRDMGGIIVIDAIDMYLYDHRKKLYEHIKYEMKNDKAKHKILPLSKFCLIQITRQRVRQELNINTTEPNPNQVVESPIAHINYIESLINVINHNRIILHIHPFIAAYLQKGLFSIQLKWFFKYKKWIKIIPRYSFKYLEYKFVDYNNNIFFEFKN
ncbi:MAG: Rne/Rng family ribonuclease [Candidatus Bostrichicola ureolyticus]|nr:MAG: Rne/Rng family ribonuclease [Candidatus Bostrichicola ureolyticus]